MKPRAWLYGAAWLGGGVALMTLVVMAREMMR